jgi:molybdopterin-guanine dinucleotide biosynthesis protein A
LLVEGATRAPSDSLPGPPKDGKYLLMDITCAILAGGLSRRMGKDKATLELGGRPLIEVVYHSVQTIFERVIVVSSLRGPIDGVGAPIVEDVLPLRSSMVGIVSALIHSRDPYVFVVGCDMPFLTEDTMKCMIDENRGEDIIIPKTQAGFEPLHAIYKRTCISYMLSLVEQGRPQVKRLFPYLSVRVVEDHPSFFAGSISPFTNINTAADLVRAKEALPL